MNYVRQAMFLSVLLGCAVTGSARGADFNKDIQLSDLKFNETIMGSQPTADSLKGKVVLVEFWGIN